MAKHILQLANDKVLDYFMQTAHYCSFELPEYVNFDEVLQFVQKQIGDEAYEVCLDEDNAENLENVNLDILMNKDGKYAVRPLSLVNPYLYFFLVREICSKSNWASIKDCFAHFRIPYIDACALPVVADKNEAFPKSTTILNWWNCVEQRSIALSLEYKYMFFTDITNCYGSINLQTLDWALARKGTQYATTSNHELANQMITYLTAFQKGSCIGIPQGSALFDFVAEIILSYSDLLFHEALDKAGVTADFEVIRYRDDYRIFCNDKVQLEKISYILQQVLESLNFRMNSQKTQISNSVVTDSIKNDKLFYLYNTPIFNKKGVDFDGFQKHLLFILMFGRDYPNGGQLKVMLSDLDKRLQEKLESTILSEYEVIGVIGNNGIERVETPYKVEIPYKLRENIRAMAAVATQIAYENIGATNYVLRIISRMVDTLEDRDEAWDIQLKVCAKLQELPNSSYNELWLQNMTYHRDVKLKRAPYEMLLCRLIMGEDIALWNNSWLKSELVSELPYETICNRELQKNVGNVVTFHERCSYYGI